MKVMKFVILIMATLLTNLVYAQGEVTLQESIMLALENNTEVVNSQLEIEAAKKVKRSAMTNYFPVISATGLTFQAEKSLMEIHSEDGNLPVYDGNPANIPDATEFAYFPSSTMGVLKEGTLGFINITQPVFTGGRILYGNKLASVGEKASESLNNITRDQIALKTEEYYWQIIALEEKYRTVEKYRQMLESLLGQVEDAFNSGIVMKNDVLKVKLKLNEILLNKSKLQNGLSLARMAFNQHLGLPQDTVLILKNELIPIESPTSLYTENFEALKMRDEYRLLELAVNAEKYQTRIKRGEYLPQAGIGAAYQYLKFDESDGRTFGMIYGTVSVPISGWWGGSYELQKHHIKEQIAKNNLDDKSELLILQMEKAWRDLNDAYTQYLLSEEAKEQALENIKVNDDSYDNGLITVSDLLEAQALLNQAKDQLTDARANYLLKKTIYLQVTGQYTPR